MFLAHTGVANSTLSSATKTSNATRKTNFTLKTGEVLHTSPMRSSTEDEAARINTAATVSSSSSNSSNATELQCCSEGGVPDGDKPNPKHTKKVLLHKFFLNLIYNLFFCLFLVRPARRQDFCLMLGHQRNRHRRDVLHRIRVSLQGKHVTRKPFSHKNAVHSSCIYLKKKDIFPVHGCHGLLCLQRGAERGEGNVRLSMKAWNYLGK